MDEIQHVEPSEFLKNKLGMNHFKFRAHKYWFCQKCKARHTSKPTPWIHQLPYDTYDICNPIDRHAHYEEYEYYLNPQFKEIGQAVKPLVTPYWVSTFLLLGFDSEDLYVRASNMPLLDYKRMWKKADRTMGWTMYDRSLGVPRLSIGWSDISKDKTYSVNYSTLGFTYAVNHELNAYSILDAGQVETFVNNGALPEDIKWYRRKYIYLPISKMYPFLESSKWRLTWKQFEKIGEPHGRGKTELALEKALECIAS